MSSAIIRLAAETKEEVEVAESAGKWMSLTSASDRFDIDCGLVHCHYKTADFTATADGDAVVVVPAAYGQASRMIAHVVISAGHTDGYRVEIAVRRSSVRCARPYRFAYVDGRCYGVLGVSDAFVFDHRGGPCDCDTGSNRDIGEDVISGGSGSNANDDNHFLRTEETTTATPVRRTATVHMSSLVSSLMDTRSSAPQCPVCNVPSNYQHVIEYLTTNIDRLSVVKSDINGERKKLIECQNKCNLLLEYYQIKTRILNAETEDCLRFADGLVSNLLKNHKTIFQVDNKTIYLKIEKTREIKISANQHFMQSIINSQRSIIDHLTARFEELSIMMNTMELFAKIL